MKKATKAKAREAAGAAAQHDKTELQELVQRHRVCWEVVPEQVPVQGERPLAVGYDLMLYGTHDPGDHPVPGCEKCKEIYRDLRGIARRIIPVEERPSRYEIAVYDSAISYSPVRRNRPDVTVKVQILHRARYDTPIDECEVTCLNEMKAKLKELGAQNLRWKSGAEG